MGKTDFDTEKKIKYTGSSLEKKKSVKLRFVKYIICMKHPRITLVILSAYFLFLSYYSINCQAFINELKTKADQELQAGNYLAALENFNQILAANPYHIEALMGVSKCFFNLEDFSAALDAAEKAHVLQKRDFNIQNHIGNILFALEDYEKAYEKFDQILKQDLYNLEANLGKAMIFQQQGRLIEAEQVFNKILKIDPHNNMALIRLAELYYEWNDLSKADTYYLKGIKANSLDFFSHYSYALFLANLQKFDQALKYIDISIDLFPVSIKAKYLKGLINMYKKNGTGAVILFKELSRQNPDNVDLLYNLAKSYEISQKYNEAINIYFKILNLRVDREIVRLALEQLLLNKKAISDPLREKAADFRQTTAEELDDENFKLYAFLHYKDALRLAPQNTGIRLKYAGYFLENNYPERYVEELKIIANTNKATQKIKDEIEIYESEIKDSLSKNQLIDQYRLEASQTSMDIFIHAENILSRHFDLENIIKEQLINIFHSFPNIRIVRCLTGKKTLAKMMQISKADKTQFFVNLTVTESDKKIELNTDVYLTLNGFKYKNFYFFETGNWKVFRALVKMAGNINDLIPVYGKIIQYKNDLAIINIGRYHGVKDDYQFDIVKPQLLVFDREKNNYIYKQENKLGEGKIVAVDEMISQIEMQYEGFFKQINTGDMVFLKPEEKEDDKQGENE